MKRRILSAFLVFAMLLSTFTLLLPAFAADAEQPSAQADQSTGKTYIWDFAEMTDTDNINEIGKSISTTSGDANLLKWNYASENTTTVKDVQRFYKTDGAIKSDLEQGYQISTGMLAAYNGYFEFENAITLKADKPWRIELSGLAPNSTHLFSNDDETQSFVVAAKNFQINGTAQKMKNGDGKYFDLAEADGGTNGRLGLNKGPATYVISNEYDVAKNEWYIHFTYVGGQGDGEYVFDNTTDTFGDLTFTSIGSKSKSFGLNDNASVKYQPYFDYIGIYENYSETKTYKTYTWNFSKATIENGKIATTGTDDNTMTWNVTENLPSMSGIPTEDGKYYAIKPGAAGALDFNDTNKDQFIEVTKTAQVSDKKLLAFGGYFDLQNSITLEADKPWSIEIKGRIPNGMNIFSGTGSSINFGTSFVTIQGTIAKIDSQSAFKYENGAVGTKVYHSTTDSTISCGGRFGQNTVNQMVRIYNKQDADGTWYIWMEESGKSSTADGIYKFKDTPTSTIGDLIFNSIGSSTSPFSVNTNSNRKYFPYLDYIKVDEDTTVDTVVTDESIATLKGKNLVLEQDIKYQFAYELSDSVLNDPEAYMQISVNGRTENTYIKDIKDKAEFMEGSYYKFSIALNAKEMSDVISLQLFSNGRESMVEKYSVKDYAKTVLKNEDKRPDLYEAQPLVKAMLNYGAAAQTQFNYRQDVLADIPANKVGGTLLTDSAMADITAEDLAANAKTALNSGNFNLVDVAASKLMLTLEDKITLNAAIAVKEGVADLTFKYNGENLGYTEHKTDEVTTHYIVSIPEVAAKEFDEAIAITVSGTIGEETVEEVFSVSVLTYCHTVLASEIGGNITENLQNTVKAIYLYNQAADAYFAQRSN